MSRSSKGSLLALAGFGLATAGAAWYASRYNRGNRNGGYGDLRKPNFTPPEKIFPVVWTTLYALIAYSGWRVWSAAPSLERNKALRLWISQLAANAQWSKMFFAQRRPVADVFMLESSIISYIAAAHKVDRAAAYAVIPYGAWIAFATVLNSEILRLNPELR